MQWRVLAASSLVLLGALASEPAEPSAGAADPHDPLAGVDDPHTLSQLLQWSLKHQDLDALHTKAEAVRQQQAGGGSAPGVLSADGNSGEQPTGLPTPADSAGGPHIYDHRPKPLTDERRVELDALAKELMPDMVALMRGALEGATSASASDDDREDELLALQELVEDIDNAKDLVSIGGLSRLLALLNPATPASMQAAVLWVLGTAVQNQHELQLALLAEPDGLQTMLRLVSSPSSPEVAAKALFALSALLRNSAAAQEAFGAADGAGTLLRLLARASAGGDAKLVRKGLVLVTDLIRDGIRSRADAGADADAEEGAPAGEGARPAGGGRQVGAIQWPDASALCEAVVAGLGSGDVDAQEKAVQALEQMTSAGMLEGSSCDLAAARSALARYTQRCEAAATEDEDAGDGAGACEEMQPVAAWVDAELAMMQGV